MSICKCVYLLYDINGEVGSGTYKFMALVVFMSPHIIFFISVSLLDILENIRLKSGHENIIDFFKAMISMTGAKCEY